jgi:hypothetical protein
MVLIESVHVLYFSVRRLIVEGRVLIIYPKTHLDSFTLLLAIFFFVDINSFLGIGSEEFNGQAIAYITSGTAVLTLLGLSFISSAIPKVSSS